MAKKLSTEINSSAMQSRTNTGRPPNPSAGNGRWWIDGDIAKIAMSDGSDIILVDSEGNQLITVRQTRDQADAFLNPIRVEPQTIFDSKQIFDEGGGVALSLYYSDGQVSGGGTSSAFDQVNAKTTLSTTLNTAGLRRRRTFRWFNYQPGKGQRVVLTRNFQDAVANNEKRSGLFSPTDGVFFMVDGTGINAVIRKNGSDTVIPEANWTYEGVLFSTRGYTIDLTTTLILFFDYEWLGVGTVRFGLQLGSEIVWVHEAIHANVASEVYMSSPNLPICDEIENDGTGVAADLDTICGTVISFGGQQTTGQTTAFDRGNSSFSTQADNDLYPLISFRLRSGWEGLSAIPISVSIISSTNANFRWFMIRNPTIAGTDAASWQTKTESGLQYDISRDNTNKLSGGHVITARYAPNAADVANEEVISTLLPGVDYAGVPDEFVLGVQNVFASTAETYLAAVNWQELN